tara:strand:- start:182 stop:901 length:720 start_codon:yes stop_codon:yes gene_type:complete
MIKNIKNLIIQTKIFNYLYFKILKKDLDFPNKLYKSTDEKNKFIHILEAVNYVKVAKLPPVFFEFGCHSGRTFSTAISSAKYLNLNLECFAFDSFEGLPETNEKEDGIFKSGTFFTSKKNFIDIVYKKTKLKISNNQIIQGYYEKSLTTELKSKLPRSVGFIHIDVDLYSSTKTVLNFIKDFLKIGTVILFDDWYCFSPGSLMGEKKAFTEFLNKNKNIQVEEWKNYSTFGKSFFVTKI